MLTLLQRVKSSDCLLRNISIEDFQHESFAAVNTFSQASSLNIKITEMTDFAWI